MTKIEMAEQFFLDKVNDALAYFSEAKSTCGADMEELEYFAIAAELCKDKRKKIEEEKLR